ncbi:MAG TPA: bifunctional glutamate N-acetyltransferase/amino-acid acetyltransferase ArgJ [Spirochaetota bacterium]|nr:bifunctional glutamate N-acetyltransferase/amino-acid acetyltransferase ArgJ [Spirochaetota bacterium]
MHLNFTTRYGLDYPSGFTAFAVNSSLKKKDPDTALLYCPCGANWGGVFSQNRFRSSSLDNAVRKKDALCKALLVCSKNANAGTGSLGAETDRIIINSLAQKLGIGTANVLVSYTGVVGVPFPWQKIKANLNNISQRALSGQKQIKTYPFADGILTTDTVRKRFAVKVNTPQGPVRFAGCAKGSGMIYPNMATMLAYITTDLAVTNKQLQYLVSNTAAESFNRITVDGDTSTNDTFIAFASGLSKVKYASYKKLFKKVFREIAVRLARAVVADGEGATKFITIRVTGCRSQEHADRIAARVANSLLLKTAVFGSDPNYGRILAAVGACGVPLRKEKVAISFGNIILYKDNKVLPANIHKAAAYLKNKNIIININTGAGKAESIFWTCDISYDYVRINAEYTT